MSASAECTHWSGRVVRSSSCAILLGSRHAKLGAQVARQRAHDAADINDAVRAGGLLIIEGAPTPRGAKGSPVRGPRANCAATARHALGEKARPRAVGVSLRSTRRLKPLRTTGARHTPNRHAQTKGLDPSRSSAEGQAHRAGLPQLGDRTWWQ